MTAGAIGSGEFVIETDCGICAEVILPSIRIIAPSEANPAPTRMHRALALDRVEFLIQGLGPPPWPEISGEKCHHDKQ